MARPVCPWCADPESEADWSEAFCREHTAEYECTTLDELDRQEREEAYDLL